MRRPVVDDEPVIHPHPYTIVRDHLQFVVSGRQVHMAGGDECHIVGGQIFAERARRALPRNTTDYQRANDIVNFAGNEVREQMEARNRRRS